MPYHSYFENAQSAVNQWGLGINDAQRICEIWNDVCTDLNGNHAKPERTNQENYFTQKLQIYDDPSTQKSYYFWDTEISKAEFKELVDIQLVLVVMRGFYTTGQTDTARQTYNTIWSGMKKRVGATDGVVRIATEFNTTYCPQERDHYVHYLAKSPDQPAPGKKPWVFDRQGKKFLRVWHSKKKKT